MGYGDMTEQKATRIIFRKSGKQLPPALFFGLLLSGVAGCSGFFYSPLVLGESSPQQATVQTQPLVAPPATELSDKEFNLDTVERQTLPPSPEYHTGTDNDPTVLLTEVSKMSDSDSISDQPALPTEVAHGQSDISDSGVSIGVTQCNAPFANNYRKSIAFASFPRALPSSSNVGALYKVEQHLPLLLSANLTTRHATLSPVHLPEGFYSADHQGEALAAAQAQQLARKHRTQFIVSGEVKDMSMTYLDKAFTHNAYRRMVNAANNLFNADSPRNSNSRIFSFELQLRDGFTGEVVFENQYETYGNWDTKESAQMGFGSPRFWQTDYGRRVQQLVAKASDDMAATVDCRPYMVRVDLRPGRQQVIIHSGANNGLRPGDALQLHQLVMHPVTGEYNNFDTHLINRNTLVYLTEVYPSHSVAKIDSDVLLNGQYLALAP